MDITPYLQLMVQKKGSDLFFTPGATVKMKLDGQMASVGKDILTPETVTDMVLGVMTEEQKKVFIDNLEVDFAISLEDQGRFRVNAFRQKGYPAMVLRLISAEVPNIDQLRVPEILKELIMHKRGLLLMVGGTGSGKSTTLAAMVDHRNANAGGHILTIEDPVEFIHPHKRSIVNQRELGPDTRSYANALKSSLR
ncbi:MAG: Flp pilus assembly complex ATPase component TadA, partial [Magnetococcales bacterium]|nr:Flp pilus assembly complex ATPase component TadA [Magnetococcales bacterium]